MTLRSGCLGFEWDTFEPTYASTMRYPPGLKFLSTTQITHSGAADENGSVYASTLSSPHHIVAYKVGPALVVNFGTNQWGWGLSDQHWPGGVGVDSTMQQATVNLLADMGCQPATLDIDLSTATNQLASWTFPTMTTLTIPDNAAVSKDSTTALRASAVWSNGITTDFGAYVNWTSSDETIATVQPGGVVFGVKQGFCTITGTYGGTTENCLLTVGPRVVPATRSCH